MTYVTCRVTVVTSVSRYLYDSAVYGRISAAGMPENRTVRINQADYINERAKALIVLAFPCHLWYNTNRAAPRGRIFRGHYNVIGTLPMCCVIANNTG